MFFCKKSRSSSSPNPAVDDPIGLDDKLNRLQAVYKIAMQNREFEISQLIQRNNFFMLFQGVFLAAVFQNQASKPYIEFWLSLLGIFMSLYQTQVAAGAKYWQEYWEVRLGEIEKRLESAMRERKGGDFFFEPLFSEKTKLLDIECKVEKKTKIKYPGYLSRIPTWFMLKKPSVSRVPIVAGITLLVFWLGIFIQTIGFRGDLSNIIYGWQITTPFEISGHHFSAEKQ